MGEKKKALLKKIDDLKKELSEVKETIEILQQENDELRGEILVRDERNNLVIEKNGLKIDKLLDLVIEGQRTEK